MKIEFELNVREENKERFYRWMRLFAMQLLMGEDETIVNCKVDDEDFSDLYRLASHM